MKHKKILIGVLILFFVSEVGIIAKMKNYSQEKPTKQRYGFEQGKHKGEFFEQKIKNLAQKGLISTQEEKELLNDIQELKKYREEVWSDGKLTKEERQSLLEKEKVVRNKIRDTINKIKQDKDFFSEENSEKKEKIFNDKIDNMVKRKRITQKEADKLKNQHTELIKLEQEIWSDGVMTEEEHKKLIETRNNFNKQYRKFLKNNE